jgi:hypothetical protein
MYRAAQPPFVPEDFDGGSDSPDDVDDAPTVTCSRCDRAWDLEYELEELRVGNRALEQFALDHERHTGHFPDEVSPWVATCRRCPGREAFLSERPARRWATTHARHTRHEVTLRHDDEGESTVAPEE